MKIVLIGSGNIATHLGKAFSDAGHQIVQVYSKTLESKQAA
jgi:predicted dinucleotide-binding enzyme